MPRREPALIPGLYYHIYNRGHNRENIFFEEQNYAFFLRRFKKYIAGRHAQLIAYVLMPNHYHFLVELLSDGFSIAMKNFTISYVKAVNKRYQRAGALFQGAFCAIYIDRNAYLLQLSRYIHLNPIKAGFVERPEDWPYSSYLEYIGARQGSFVKPGIVLEQFGIGVMDEDTPMELVAPVYRRYADFVESDMQDRLGEIKHLLFD